MATTQPTFDDILRLFQETDRKFQDTDRKMLDTDRKMQDTDRRIKEMSASIGRLGNRLGDFVEDAVRPAAVRLFKERGIVVHEVQQNVSVQRGEEGIEIDLMVVNDTEAVAVECKSNLKIDDVQEHLERLGKLKRLLPRYADFKLMGAVAALVTPDHVARYAYAQGLFVIGQSGDHLEIGNDLAFKPAVW
jgi:hypothetical protein